MGSNASVIVTVNDIIENMFAASGGTTGYRIYTAVKLRSVEIWGAVQTPGNNSISFSWSDGGAGQDVGTPSQTIVDTSSGLQDIPHLCLRPPSSSNASLWLSSTNNADPLFYLAAPQYSTVDISFTALLAEGAGGAGSQQTAITTACTGATAGLIYQRTLPSASVNSLVPFLGQVA